MCRRTEEEVGPTVGLPRHRHFVGFFNVPVELFMKYWICQQFNSSVIKFCY